MQFPHGNSPARPVQQPEFQPPVGYAYGHTPLMHMQTHDQGHLQQIPGLLPQTGTYSYSLGSPNPTFHPQPLSPGPVPPFPPPQHAVLPAPRLMHSPPPQGPGSLSPRLHGISNSQTSWMTSQYPPSLSPAFPFVSAHASTLPPPLTHPQVICSPQVMIPHQSGIPTHYAVMQSETIPLSHPQFVQSQPQLIHPMVPAGAHQHQGVVRPIPIYRAPPPGFESLIGHDQGLSHQPPTTTEQQLDQGTHASISQKALSEPQTSSTGVEEEGGEE